jgi:pyrroloquinoline-quinone synthase
LLDNFDELAEHGSMAQAVAAFYAYESQVPEIAARKIEGLRKFYGITEARALAYFAVHMEADVRHRRRIAADGAQQRAVFRGAAAAMD